MSVVKLLDNKSTKDPMQILELNETMDQLANAICVCWHENV